MASEELTGRQWLERLTTSAGEATFHANWLLFAVGQLGGFTETVKENPRRKDELDSLASQFEADIRDFAMAAQKLVAVATSMHANALETIADLPRPRE